VAKSKRSKPKRIGDLQLKILEVLWRLDEAGVADVQRALASGRAHAYTTIATMLRKMEERGLVVRRVEGRRGIYRATVAADEVRSGLLDDVVERVFHGRVEDVVLHLVEHREVSADELRRLAERLADESSRKGGRGAKEPRR